MRIIKTHSLGKDGRKVAILIHDGSGGPMGHNHYLRETSWFKKQMKTKGVGFNLHTVKVSNPATPPEFAQPAELRTRSNQGLDERKHRLLRTLGTTGY